MQTTSSITTAGAGQKQRTKVIFRSWLSGAGIIALFPQEPSDRFGHYCSSYEHVGQHGAASPDLNHATRLATPEEYAPLFAKLTRLGYRLAIGKKVTARDNAIRRQAALKS